MGEKRREEKKTKLTNKQILTHKNPSKTNLHKTNNNLPIEKESKRRERERERKEGKFAIYNLIRTRTQPSSCTKIPNKLFSQSINNNKIKI